MIIEDMSWEGPTVKNDFNNKMCKFEASPVQIEHRMIDPTEGEGHGTETALSMRRNISTPDREAF